APARLPGIQRERSVGPRDGQLSAAQARLHHVPYLRLIDGEAAIHCPNDAVEGFRIEIGNTRILERHGAGAAQRSDQRRRAESAPLRLRLQRQSTRHQWTRLAADEQTQIDVRQRKSPMRRQAFRTGTQLQLTQQTASRHLSVEVLEARLAVCETYEATHR